MSRTTLGPPQEKSPKGKVAISLREMILALQSKPRHLCRKAFASHIQRTSAIISRSEMATPNVRHTATRTGLTLLEIVLSLAIFFSAVVTLAQLAWTGSRAAVQARLRTQATIRCETKLNEVLAGAEAMQSASGMAFPDDPKWTWSQVVTGTSHPELMQIDLTVAHRGGSSMANIDVTIRRWARQQAVFVQAVTQEKAEAEKKANSQ